MTLGQRVQCISRILDQTRTSLVQPCDSLEGNPMLFNPLKTAFSCYPSTAGLKLLSSAPSIMRPHTRALQLIYSLLQMIMCLHPSFDIFWDSVWLRLGAQVPSTISDANSRDIGSKFLTRLLLLCIAACGCLQSPCSSRSAST